MNAPTTPSAEKKIITRHLIVAVALVSVAVLLWSVIDAIIVAFGGIVVATVLLAMARPLRRLTHLAHRWNLMIVIVGLLGIALLIGWFFGNQVADELSGLMERLPEAVTKVEAWLGESSAGRMVIESIRDAGADKESVARATAGVAALLGAAGHFLLILFLGIYFAFDPVLYRDGAVRLVPVNRRPQLKRALNDAGVALKKWLVAQGIAMLGVGVLTGTVMALLDVPFALGLGILAGLLEFIPVIGPVVAAVPGILLAFSVGPQMAVYVTLAYVGVQQVESNVITPLVQRWAVQLPPVLALIAILVFGLLFGVLGVIFAMPIAVVVMILVKDLYIEDTLEANEGSGRRKPASGR